MAYYGRDGNAQMQSAMDRINRGELPKGVPVPRTGKRGNYGLRDSAGKTSGVSGNSRIVPHRYLDEGDNGKTHRREVRRKEREAWISEWKAEEMEYSDKFASILAKEFYEKTMDSQHDEELGDSDNFGWFAIFNEDRVIVQVDGYGFVYATQHDSDAAVSEAWDEISMGWDEYSLTDEYGW